MSNCKSRCDVLNLLLARLESFNKLVKDEVDLTLTATDDDFKDLLHRMMADAIRDLTRINTELQEIRELTGSINKVLALQ